MVLMQLKIYLEEPEPQVVVRGAIDILRRGSGIRGSGPDEQHVYTEKSNIFRKC
jgi:hypothetical protein